LLGSGFLEDATRAIAFGWRGHVYFSNQQYSRAYEDLTESIRLSTEFNKDWVDLSIVYTMRGTIHLNQERIQDALVDFQAASSLKPSSLTAIYYRMLSLKPAMKQNIDQDVILHEINDIFDGITQNLGGSQHETVQRIQGMVTELSPEAMQQQLQQFGIAMELGADAIEYFKQQLSVFNFADTDMLTRRLQSQAMAAEAAKCLVQGRPNDALVACNKAAKLGMSQAEIGSIRANAYYQLRRYELALNDVNIAIKLIPMTELFCIRGRIYRQLERYDDALDDLNRSLESKPDDGAALADRGVTYRKMKKYDESLADLNRSIELKPTYWRLYSRALLWLQLDKRDLAMLDICDAIRLANEYGEKQQDLNDLILDMVNIYLVAGDSQKAEEIYQRALKECRIPDNDIIGDLGEFLELFPEHDLANVVRASMRSILDYELSKALPE
jgi:tetratricopeptide (TPR) repeat protein